MFNSTNLFHNNAASIANNMGKYTYCMKSTIIAKKIKQMAKIKHNLQLISQDYDYRVHYQVLFVRLLVYRGRPLQA